MDTKTKAATLFPKYNSDGCTRKTHVAYPSMSRWVAALNSFVQPA